MTTKKLKLERMIHKMNYSQKRTLVGRIIYVALTLMAVTTLIATMYTFFGSSKRSDKDIPPITEGTDNVTTETNGTVTDNKPTDVDTEEPAADVTEDIKPTDTPPAKDWTKLKVMMPVQGVIYKRHDLTNAVFSLTMNDYRVHQGIDIECAAGDDVVSCAYGKIKTVGYDPFMGYTVIVDHGDGLVSTYKNLSDTVADGISAGATVYAGQKLGTVGESAIIEISDEPHLHFELTLNDKLIDPMTMLDYDEDASVSGAANQDK